MNRKFYLLNLKRRNTTDLSEGQKNIKTGHIGTG
jgi:hypothetical protein